MENFNPQNRLININEYIDSPQNTICRLCLNKFHLNELEYLFQPFHFSQGDSIAGFVSRFANIPIHIEDCFSKVICRYCLGRLNETAYFRNVIWGCNGFLSNLYANYNQNRTPIYTGNNLDMNLSEIPTVISGGQTQKEFENPIGEHEKEESVIKNENSNHIECSPLKLDAVVVEEEEDDTKIDITEHSLLESVPKLELDLGLGEIDTGDSKSDPPKRKKKKKYPRNVNLRYPCKYCDRIFKSKSCHDAHLIKHNGNYYKCEDCGKQFANKYRFSRHKKTHNKEVALECEECGRLFAFPCELQKHMESHSETPKYQCDVCGKRYRYSDSLQSHKIYHGKQIEQKCEICNKIFRSYDKSVLKKHMRRHSGNVEKLCPICGKTLKSLDGYKAHLKQHNGELDFACELCPKKYSKKRNLTDHMTSVHSERKPYSCEICGKTFALQSGWYLHGRVHAKENPFTCTVCEKRFGYSSHLKGHLRVVHGIREN